VVGYQHFRGPCCLHLQEEVKLVSCHNTTRYPARDITPPPPAITNSSSTFGDETWGHWAVSTFHYYAFILCISCNAWIMNIYNMISHIIVSMRNYPEIMLLEHQHSSLTPISFESLQKPHILASPHWQVIVWELLPPSTDGQLVTTVGNTKPVQSHTTTVQ
jgi:hypothetical protein